MNTESLILDYQNGMSIAELKAKYHFKGDGTIYYHLKKHNITHRGKVVHYENPFLKDTPESRYWLGWIFSDGCIVNTKKHKYVYLACLDEDILSKFKDFCGDRAKLNSFTYTTPVSKETKKMYKVVVNSSELVDYFKETFNITGKKSNTLNPDITISWDLLRGVYDGDGSFKKGVVLTSCSKEWIDKIKAFYDENNLHYTLTKDSAYRLGIYKKEDLKRVYSLLYDNDEICLQRKKDDLYRLAKE